MLKKLFKVVVSASMVLSMAMTSVGAASTGVATGTQTPFVSGEDWGCGVSKTIIALDKVIDADSVAKTDFAITETKAGMFGPETAERIIEDAYVSDAVGNKVTENSKYVTVEMYISQSHGGAAVFSLDTWRNSWCTPYELDVQLVEGQTLTSAGETINSLEIAPELDLQKMVCPQLNGFELHNDGFKSTTDYTLSYALYKPATDTHTNALVVWNHGIGETGTDVKIDLLCNEVTALGGAEFQKIMGGAYVLVPQRRIGMDSNENEAVFELITKIVNENPDIDPNRVIVGGCSAGGKCTVDLINKHADYFAAAFPICAAGGITAETVKEMPALATLPIFWIHSQDDDTVDFSSTVENIKVLEAAGNKNMHLFAPEHVYTNTTAPGFPETGMYSGHWSWVYFDNNEAVCDDDQVSCWEWMAQQRKEAPTITATQTKVVIEGEDWGPSVSKVIMTVEKPVKAADINAATFNVYETKESTNWANLSVYNATAARKVVGVYLSDAKGNKVDAAEGTTITVEMYISPNDGSPFRYDVPSGSNKWCEPYELAVEGLIGEAKVVSQKSYKLKGGEEWINDLAHSFDVTKTYKAKDGYTYAYGEFKPAADDHKNALVIWLHGAGEGMATGTFDNDNYVDILGNEVTAYVDEEFQKLFDGAYVITPQAPTMWMSQPDTHDYPASDGSDTDIRSEFADGLFELIEAYVAGNPDVDKDRIIIGGCSNGGYMTMNMIIDHPDYFHKAFPICEAYYDSAITDEQIKALAESDIGIWFTHALADTTVDPTTTTLPTVERLLKAGADVHFTKWEKVEDLSGRFDTDGAHHEYAGHWSWIYFDNNENNTCTVHGQENEWKWLAEVKPAQQPTTPDTPVTPEKPGTTPSVGIYNNAAYVAIAAVALAGAAYVATRKKED